MTERIIKANISRHNIDDYDWDEITVVDGDIYLAGYDKDFKPSALRVCGNIIMIDYYYDVDMPNLMTCRNLYRVNGVNIIKTPLLKNILKVYDVRLPSQREREYKGMEINIKKTEKDMAKMTLNPIKSET